MLYRGVFLRCVLSQIIEKLNIKNYVQNGTKANPNRPLDIEEVKKARRRKGGRDAGNRLRLMILMVGGQSEYFCGLSCT